MTGYTKYSRSAVDRLMREISDKYNIDLKSLTTHCKVSYIVMARWELWSRMRDLGAPFADIGKLTGHDHSTVIYGVRKYRSGGVPYGFIAEYLNDERIAA